VPGWFIHSEVAKNVAQHLSDTPNLPAQLGIDPVDAKKYGDMCHKWRNFLAIGAIGPDMFYLLPDYPDGLGNALLALATTLVDLWGKVDDTFVGSWEKWMGPVGANDADLTAQISGDLSNQIAQGLDEVNAALLNAELTIITRGGDLFGLLTSAVPQGFEDTAFYWSDMFHYRSTYAYPKELWRLATQHLADAGKMEADLGAGGHVLTDAENQSVADARAAAESEAAFAIGWITHCATDVTGHPFTNAKCGGPFRLHWQRHHLVENHFDAAGYNVDHMGAPVYEELGTSALHFRVAFRLKQQAPYNGSRFAPMYDYFTDFPAYPVGETAIDDEKRTRFFDVDPGELPDHLVALITDAMTIYGTNPQVLNVAPPQFNVPGTGRPDAAALNVMWQIFFRYLKMVSSSGLHPRQPMPPQMTGDHPFPTPPGGALPPEDEARGADPGDDSGSMGSFNLFDALIAVLAWIKYIGQLIEWLLTVLPGLVLDPLTFVPREFLYYTVIGPLWSLYMASRKLLVLGGFLTPKPEEIEDGLITQGHGTGFQRRTLAQDLNDPLGFAMTTTTFDEPSGRPSTTTEWDGDPAYPRQTVTDTVPQLNQFLAMLGLPLLSGPPAERKNSQWVAPWRYPDTSLAGTKVGWESPLTHVGPWNQGDTAAQLLASQPTDLAAADALEQANTPEATAAACHAFLPLGEHLGNPLDYSLYLVNNLAFTNVKKIPDFNLDSDRGYAWHCWDWERHARPDANDPPAPGSLDDFLVHRKTDRFGLPVPAVMDFQQPCTPPEQFNADWAANKDAKRQDVNEYDPLLPLRVHYLEDGAPSVPCTGLASVAKARALILRSAKKNKEWQQAKMRPDGASA
jgi:hypothetical protein